MGDTGSVSRTPIPHPRHFPPSSLMLAHACPSPLNSGFQEPRISAECENLEPQDRACCHPPGTQWCQRRLYICSSLRRGAMPPPPMGGALAPVSSRTPGLARAPPGGPSALLHSALCSHPCSASGSWRRVSPHFCVVPQGSCDTTAASSCPGATAWPPASPVLSPQPSCTTIAGNWAVERGDCLLPRSPHAGPGFQPSWQDGVGGMPRCDLGMCLKSPLPQSNVGVSQPCGQGQHFLEHSTLAK